MAKFKKARIILSGDGAAVFNQSHIDTNMTYISVKGLIEDRNPDMEIINPKGDRCFLMKRYIAGVRELDLEAPVTK